MSIFYAVLAVAMVVATMSSGQNGAAGLLFGGLGLFFTYLAIRV